MKRLVLVRTVGRCARVPIRGYIRVGGGHSVAALAVPIRGRCARRPIRGRCARRSNAVTFVLGEVSRSLRSPFQVVATFVLGEVSRSLRSRF